MRVIILLLVLFIHFKTSAQDPSGYLRMHCYTFSPSEGFTGPLGDTLARKLSAFRLIFQAEGGSHALKLYDQLELAWLEFLNQRLGVTCFIGEYGASIAVLFNQILQHGDTSIRLLRHREFLQAVYRYNLSRLPSQRLFYAGVDFERENTYIRALKLLLPGLQPADPSISSAVERIRLAPDTGFSCDDMLRFNKDLKRSLNASETAYQQYLGANFLDFERIVRNNGSCKDRLRNRNPHLAANIIALDQVIGANRYYAEFGEAHTILKNKVLAGILSRSGPFQGKVAVINLYCQDCSTPEEGTSNWALKGINADIERYFLPLCKGDLTLFDLTGNDPSIAGYRSYGQFLIVAKRQH